MNNKSIALDDLGTWPSSLVEFLEKNFGALQTFQLEENRRSRARDHNSNQVPNACAEYEKLVGECHNRLSGLRIVGYHASRLCDDEVDDIRTGGMQPYTESFRRSRIERRRERGDISAEHAEVLLSKTRNDAKTRTNKVHFTFVRRDVETRDGIVRLLESWGGEAIYSCHEAHGGIADPRLGRIGKPRIIVVALNAPSVDLYGDAFGAHVVRRYLAHRGVDVFWGCEGYATRVGPEDVIEVATLGEPRFLELTHYNEWPEPLT